jgi:DNA replication protein DnaC
MQPCKTVNNRRKMDEDQLQAYQLALSGHNLLILGQAGTGKTFLTVFFSELRVLLFI